MSDTPSVNPFAALLPPPATPLGGINSPIGSVELQSHKEQASVSKEEAFFNIFQEFIAETSETTGSVSMAPVPLVTQMEPLPDPAKLAIPLALTAGMPTMNEPKILMLPTGTEFPGGGKTLPTAASDAAASSVSITPGVAGANQHLPNTPPMALKPLVDPMPPAAASNVASQIGRELSTAIYKRPSPPISSSGSAVVSVSQAIDPVENFSVNKSALPWAESGLSAAGTSPAIGSDRLAALGVAAALVDKAQLTAERHGTAVDALRSALNLYTADRAAPTTQTTQPIAIPHATGSSGWDQALGQRILWMADKGLGKAELRLDPPNLGTVTVRISMQDEQAQLFFQAAHPGAREALESALPRLRELFFEQGLQLGQTDISGQDESGGKKDSHGNEQDLEHNTATLIDNPSDAPSELSGDSHMPDSASVLMNDGDAPHLVNEVV